ncbi:hypothetical protein PsYK624_119510 [Phanerochaete sordida]|uniref:Uncharacterized protein n=1 Tax=Phanerochaete sordida TaxID=48140 RepID=A0A9P3GLQ5_9APHY|nr:hypothetical protein PsYK624_119510 [Phanerochaete sordida]
MEITESSEACRRSQHQPTIMSAGHTNRGIESLENLGQICSAKAPWPPFAKLFCTLSDVCHRKHHSLRRVEGSRAYAKALLPAFVNGSLYVSLLHRSLVTTVRHIPRGSQELVR